MLKKLVFVLFAFLSINYLANSEQQFQISDWKLYTSFHNVTVSDVDIEGRIWCGTTGGLFIYDKNNQVSKTFNSLNGLLNNEVSYIFYDENSRNMFIGLSDGTLEIFDSELNITHITSIRDANFANSKITKIASLGNILYISGGFGLTTFDINNKIFISTIVKISDWNKNSQINDFLFDENNIWVSSELGLAKATLNSLLEVPNNWTTYSSSKGLLQTDISSIQKYNNKLYFAAKNHIYIFDGDSLIISQNFDDDILKIKSIDGELFVVTRSSVKKIDNSIFYNSSINCLGNRKHDNKLIFNTGKGIIIYSGDNVSENYYPNSPFNNSFSSMTVDEQGKLWTVPAHLAASYFHGGITCFADNKWVNYNSKQFPDFKGDNFFQISYQPNGKIYSTTFGGGLAVADPYADSVVFNFFSERNEKFMGSKGPEDPFLVIGDCKLDSRGTIWCTNWGKQTVGPILVAIDKDGNSNAYSNCYISNERRILKLAIDNAGTKWVGSYPGEGIGIFYFNERNTPDNSSDDVCGMISTSTHSGLPDNSPTVMKKDANGRLWFGFRQGLSVVVNPTAVLSKSTIIVRSISFLNNQKVYDVLIDPVGYVWVATATGIWVLNKDAYEVIANINKSNSPLLTDNILSLAGDFSNGVIYVGTEQGLYSFKSLSVTPNADYDITCYPQPFDLKKNEEMIIDGLTAESEVKIITINGELVQTLKAQGKKAVWNGRDFNNKKVSGGVYLVVASSAISNSGSVQKIAVFGD